MMNLIRSTYHYSDEYILSKSVRWVRNSYELCQREKYNGHLQLAQMVMHMYASGISKDVQPPKTFGELLMEHRGNKAEEKVWFADDTKLASFGIKVKTPKKK